VSDHLGAIAARIQALGIEVYDASAERPDYDPRHWSQELTPEQQAAWTLPEFYAILTAPTLRKVAMTVDGARSRVRDYVQVTVAGRSGWQVRHWNGDVHDVLDLSRFVVGDEFQAAMKLSATGIITTDKDVTPHRAYCVDTYRYFATPI